MALAHWRRLPGNEREVDLAQLDEELVSAVERTREPVRIAPLLLPPRMMRSKELADRERTTTD